MQQPSFHWLSMARTLTISAGHEEAPSVGEVLAALQLQNSFGISVVGCLLYVSALFVRFLGSALLVPASCICYLQ